MSLKSSPDVDSSLIAVDLRGEQDLVAFIRRTRAAAIALRLPARTVWSLSAAAYELGRVLLGSAGARAELRVFSDRSLEVVYRLPLTSMTDGRVVSAQVRAAAAPLRGMVTDIRVDERENAVLAYLRVLPSAGSSAGPQVEASSEPATTPASEGEPLQAAALRRRYSVLDQAYRELQAELHETNRGVVALHAELDLQADQLRQAEDRLRLLLDSVQDYAICMLTPAGEVATWNSGAERLFGYAAGDIIGRPFARFYERRDRDRGIPSKHLHHAGADGRFACERRQVRRDGATFDAHVVLTTARRGDEGELRGFSLVVRDVTERKRLEADLRRRAEDLAAANRAKENFLATLSHELRTPLNAMLGWTRLLRLGRLDAQGRIRALETIERNARMQEQLIADILDVSRIVTGKLRLELRPLALAPVVEAALESVRPAAQAKGVHLCSETLCQPTVRGDRNRLQQVIWNLLVNAVKFTPPDGRVTIRIAQEGPHATVAVTDTGEGIAPDLLPVIFDRFTQGDPSATRSHGGLGLGLSIVRHIVELHGGRVHASSEGQGRGARFAMYLPQARAV